MTTGVDCIDALEDPGADGSDGARALAGRRSSPSRRRSATRSPTRSAVDRQHPVHAGGHSRRTSRRTDRPERRRHVKRKTHRSDSFSGARSRPRTSPTSHGAARSSASASSGWPRTTSSPAASPGAAAALAADGGFRSGSASSRRWSAIPACSRWRSRRWHGMYPGRLLPGIGLGVPAWIDQMGLTPPLPAQRDARVRHLGPPPPRRRGAHREGQLFEFKSVKAHPPVPARRSRCTWASSARRCSSCRARSPTAPSSRCWPEPSTCAGRASRSTREARGRTHGPHRIVTFAFFSVDDDGGRARDRLRATDGLLPGRDGAQLADRGVRDRRRARRARRGRRRGVAAGMTEQWIDDLAVAGSPASARRRSRRCWTPAPTPSSSSRCRPRAPSA